MGANAPNQQNAPKKLGKNALNRQNAPKKLGKNAPNQQNAPKKLGKNAPKDLSALQTNILELIRNTPESSYEYISKILEKNQSTIKRNIQKMKTLGILQRSGSKKKGHWEIIQKPKD